MTRFLQRNWFLLGLASAFFLGAIAHGPLEPIAQLPWLRNGIVFGVLLAMTLPLQAETIWKVIRRPFPALLASAVNMGLIPPMAWLVSWMLPTALAHGLIVAAATPCTVASAAVWTRKAGGNDAVAIMVTVLTNLSCFAVTPLWVWWLAGQSDASIDLDSMIVRLSLLVVLPMVLAQLLRLRTSIAVWATAQKTGLSNLSQCGILVMVLIGSVRMGQRLFGDDSAEFSLGALGGTLILVTVIHIAALTLGVALARLGRMDRPERIAVGIAGSQKTLLVGLTVSLEIGASILPIVLYHVSQLVIDSLLADRWGRSDR